MRAIGASFQARRSIRYFIISIPDLSRTNFHCGFPDRINCPDQLSAKSLEAFAKALLVALRMSLIVIRII